MTMHYRKNNEATLSEIGIGCYPLSGAYGKVNLENFKKVIQEAYAHGVNFFDTADTYGDYGEQILGDVIKPFRQNVIIATKVGILLGTEPNLSSAYINKSVEKSLSKLQTDYIDIYQIQFDDHRTPVDEIIETLDGLVQQGKIRYFGVCQLPYNVIKKYAEFGNLFSVSMEFSALSQDVRGKLLPYCQKNHLAGIAHNVTGRGILTGKYNSSVTFEPGDIRILEVDKVL